MTKYLLIATLAVAGLANSLNAMEQRQSWWQQGATRFQNWMNRPQNYKTLYKTFLDKQALREAGDKKAEEEFAPQRQLIIESLEANPKFQSLTQLEKSKILYNIPEMSLMETIYEKPKREIPQNVLKDLYYYPFIKKRHNLYGTAWDDLHNVPDRPYSYRKYPD